MELFEYWFLGSIWPEVHDEDVLLYLAELHDDQVGVVRVTQLEVFDWGLEDGTLYSRTHDTGGNNKT